MRTWYVATTTAKFIKGPCSSMRFSIMNKKQYISTGIEDTTVSQSALLQTSLDSNSVESKTTEDIFLMNQSLVCSLEKGRNASPTWPLPLPWKGRLGFACLNTVLRALNPPIFCSRTCRIDSINNPEKGMNFVKELGRQNAADLAKLIQWNERFGIRFLRMSSEMFPFASHQVYGYTLEYADKELKEAGRLAMKFNHRLTTHPGQFTQIASPRSEVFENSVRDLEYHAEMIQRLGLQGQNDKDAVMILHIGGVYGDRQATMQRFRENYQRLSSKVKARLVLENDDVCWGVEDVLPLCQELGIPMVLDWHHHAVMFHRALVKEKYYFLDQNLTSRPSPDDTPCELPSHIIKRAIVDAQRFVPEINETWKKKGIKPKQHYSEPEDFAVTPHQQRSHSKRVYTLPPCGPDMDLMIEAKDKEQAVFELCRILDLDNPKCPDRITSPPEDDNCPQGYYALNDEVVLKHPPRRRKKVSNDDNDNTKDSVPTPNAKGRKIMKKRTINEKAKSNALGDGSEKTSLAKVRNSSSKVLLQTDSEVERRGVRNHKPNSRDRSNREEYSGPRKRHKGVADIH